MTQIAHIRQNVSYPLSRMQEYLISRCIDRDNEPWIYHTQFSYFLRINELSLPLFFKAIKSVIDRHPILKTVFIKDEKGAIHQFVKEDLNLKIEFEDLSQLQEVDQKNRILSHLTADRNNPFDFIHGTEPNIRTYVHKRGANLVHLTMSINHCIWDGWSHVVFLKEIFGLYQKLKIEPGYSLPEGVYDYREFVQNELKTSNDVQAKLFWQHHLKNWTDFTPERNQKAINYNEYHHIEILLSSELTNKINFFQRQERVTLKSIYLTAFYRIIFNETKLPSGTIGVVTNGRSFELSNPLKTLGLLWNLAPVCVENTEDDFQLLKMTNKALSEVNAHGSYPLKSILEDQQVDSLFHAAFNFINFENANVLGDNSDVELLEIEGIDKFHFPLHLLVGKHPFDKTMSLAMNYDTRYYNELQIREKLSAFIETLENMCLSK